MRKRFFASISSELIISSDCGFTRPLRSEGGMSLETSQFRNCWPFFIDVIYSYSRSWRKNSETPSPPHRSFAHLQNLRLICTVEYSYHIFHSFTQSKLTNNIYPHNVSTPSIHGRCSVSFFSQSCNFHHSTTRSTGAKNKNNVKFCCRKTSSISASF